MLKRLLFLLLPLSVVAQGTDTAMVDLVVSHSYVHYDHLYIGIPNPVTIAVPGVECGAFDVSVTRGRIEGSGCSFVITPDVTEAFGLVSLEVQWIDGETQRTSTRSFWPSKIPLPTARFAGLGFEDDTIPVSHAKAGDGLVVLIRDQRLDDMGYRHSRFQVDHFQLTITRNCEAFFTGRSNEAVLPPEMKASLQAVEQGDMILFSEIHYFDDSGDVQLARPIRLLVK